MPVPYVFASLPNGTAIPLSYLDADFAYLTNSPVFSGNVSIGGTLTVSGAALFGGSLGATGSLTTGTQQTVQGSLVLANTAAGAFSTTIRSSNSASAAWTLTLPPTSGTNNYVLTTNGSGVTSWSQVSLTTGVTGVLPVANGGTNASSAGITAFNNITGYAAAGATGTTSTNIVFSESPTVSYVILAAGSATAGQSPLKMTTGSNLATPEAGALEYNGINKFFTIDTTSGRGITPTMQLFRLSANGSNITTIADFFGSTSAITLVSGGVYEIEWTVYFTQNTGAGTVTFTITSSQAPVFLNAVYNGSPVGGIGTVGTAQFAGIQGSTSTAAALPATGSLSAATHQYTVKAIVEAYASGTSTIRLRATSSANSITPLRGSYYKLTRLSAGNTGTFVA